MLLKTLLTLSFISYPAAVSACVVYSEFTRSPELIEIQQEYEAELKLKTLKSKIEVAVWGVFVPSYTDIVTYPPTYTFIIGERLKGSIPNKIRVVSRNIPALNANEIHYLNLRELHDGRWTNDGINQTRLSWSEYACNINPGNSRCAVLNKNKCI